MTLRTAFETSNTYLSTLHEEFSALQVTLREDKPDDTAVADILGDKVDDLLCWLEQALAAAREGQRAVDQGPDLNRAWQALTSCQETFIHLQYKFFDLISYDSLESLMRADDEAGAAWTVWVRSVKEGLDRCQQPLYNISQALAQCWQEVADRVGMTSVSIRTSNIGQKIKVSRDWDMATERLP